MINKYTGLSWEPRFFSLDFDLNHLISGTKSYFYK